MFKDDNTKWGLRTGCAIMLASAVVTLGLLWAAGRLAGAW